MAKCSIFVVLALSLGVFARDCDRVLSNRSPLDDVYPCDECISCGAKWCGDINMEYQHCKTGSVADNWCSGKQEGASKVEETSRPGKMFEYSYLRGMVSVGNQRVEEIKILEMPTEPKAYGRIVSPPQLINDKGLKVDLDGTILAVTTPAIQSDFCSGNATSSSFTVQVGLVGYSEEVTLEFQVACACECSRNIQRNSSECSHRGDYSCGFCRCDEGWEGKRCETKKCPSSSRGDIGMEAPPTCYSASKPHEACSGNGRCDDYCNVCECFDDVSIAGSQYFHPETHCENICSLTSQCVDCLTNPEPGLCDCDYIPRIFMHDVNESRLNETEKGRKVWVHCNVTLPDCGLLRYAAMKNDEYQVMVLSSCDGRNELLAGSPVIVPVGVAAAMVLAGVAAVAGYAAHKSRLPALRPAAPTYSNIGGEDSVGVNPLYVDPTSSFKNPMYGKGG